MGTATPPCSGREAPFPSEVGQVLLEKTLKDIWTVRGGTSQPRAGVGVREAEIVLNFPENEVRGIWGLFAVSLLVTREETRDLNEKWGEERPGKVEEVEV